MRSILKFAVVTALGMVVLPVSTFAQQAIKDQIVGTWQIVSAIDTMPDGTKIEPWGAGPKGVYTFDANNRFTQIILRSDLPKLQSRLAGTPEQHKTIAHGVIASYGTYSVDEAGKVINMKIEGSTFASSDGQTSKRLITSLTADEFRFTNPATTLGGKAETVWKRVK